jgi:hypothetical protein
MGEKRGQAACCVLLLVTWRGARKALLPLRGRYIYQGRLQTHKHTRTFPVSEMYFK